LLHRYYSLSTALLHPVLFLWMWPGCGYGIHHPFPTFLLLSSPLGLTIPLNLRLVYHSPGLPCQYLNPMPRWSTLQLGSQCFLNLHKITCASMLALHWIPTSAPAPTPPSHLPFLTHGNKTIGLLYYIMILSLPTSFSPWQIFILSALQHQCHLQYCQLSGGSYTPGSGLALSGL